MWIVSTRLKDLDTAEPLIEAPAEMYVFRGLILYGPNGSLRQVVSSNDSYIFLCHSRTYLFLHLRKIDLQ